MGGPETSDWTQRHYFLLRRLHSLLGLVPVGVFVVLHLTINSTILFGGDAFQTGVDQIHLLGKLGILVPVEVVGIFLPLFFHALFGVMIWMGSTPTVATYRYGGNFRYTLQRISGLIAFVFIMVHLWHMHWLGEPLGGAFFDPHHAADSAASAMQRSVIYGPIYVVGVLSTVFHLSNGIWTSLITWGITVGKQSQRTAGWACAAFGIVLALAGLGAIRGFMTLTLEEDQPPAREVEVSLPGGDSNDALASLTNNLDIIDEQTEKIHG